MDAGGAADESATLRTAKSCGPDAPTLASSFAEVSARRRWQTSPVTGERAEETVKTIACGNAGRSGETCGDYARVLFCLAREAAGASCAPGVPHALCFGAEDSMLNSDASR